MAKYIPRNRILTFEFGDTAFEIMRTKAELDRIVQTAVDTGKALLIISQNANESDGSPLLYEKSIEVAKSALNGMLNDSLASEKITGGEAWLLEDYVDAMAYILAQVSAARQIRLYDYSPQRAEA